LTVTIDDKETAADAMAAKKIAYESIEKPYPSDKWHFLTGNIESINKLCQSVGFHYVKNGDDFDHPIGLIILSADGKVVRYILGTDFLPMDLKMSLMQASKGVVTPTIARVLRFCFSYNPKSHQFIFNTLRVSATVIFILIAGFIIFLIFSGKNRKNRGVK
jgi:protein SCO1